MAEGEGVRFWVLLLREREVEFLLLTPRERDFVRERSIEWSFDFLEADEDASFLLWDDATADLAALDSVSGDTTVDFVFDFLEEGIEVFAFFDGDAGFFSDDLGGDFRWAFFVVDLGDLVEDDPVVLFFLARWVDACFLLVGAMVD